MPPLDEAYPHHRLAIEVSLWSADLGALAEEVKRLTPWADLFHFDASDTRFITSPLFFPDLVAALRPHTTVPFHVHLMAERAATLSTQFAAVGADLITIHAEATDTAEALSEIRSHDVRAGLAVTPDTPIEAVVAHLDMSDAVIVVGTRLGTRGTVMDPRTPQYIRLIRHLLDQRVEHIPVIADGGIRRETVPGLARAGADAVVAGSILLGSPDLVGTAQWLRRHPTARSSPVEAD